MSQSFTQTYKNFHACMKQLGLLGVGEQGAELRTQEQRTAVLLR